MITQHQPYSFEIKNLSMHDVLKHNFDFIEYNKVLRAIKTPIQEQVRQVLDCVDDILMPKIGS